MKRLPVLAMACSLVALMLPTAASAVSINPDGSAVVSNPTGMTALPAPVAGQPLFPTVRGGVPFFLDDNASEIMTPYMAALVGQSAGAYGLRQMVYWPSVEPGTDNTWNWSSTDALYVADIAYGQRPIWTILDTPRSLLSSSDQQTCPAASGRYCARLEPADSNQAYQLGYELARRYPLVGAFEWRNESNLTRTQANGATDFVESPAYYARSLTAFANGVHAAEAARSGPRVLGGALANAWDDLQRYADAILAQGVGRAIDGLSLHLYDIQKTATYSVSSLKALAAVLAKYPGMSGMRLVNTEIGAPRAATGVGNYVFSDKAYGTSPTMSPSVSDRLLGTYKAYSARNSSIPLVKQIDGIGFFSLVPLTNYAASYGLFTFDGTSYSPTWAFCDIRRLIGGAGLQDIPSGFGVCKATPAAAPSSL